MTLDKNGKTLTEDQDGVSFPVNYSFELVNDFVHSPECGFEELQHLCLSMASHIGKQEALIKSQDTEEYKLINERDHWEEKATELANDIGKALGFSVGEHSNINCPVQEAIDGVYHMSGQIEEWRDTTS